MTNERLRGAGGFTLIELLLVVTVVGILGSIAIPSMIRARGAAAETSAIASLRMIHASETTYASSCGYGYYAASIATLATPPNAGSPAFISPEFTSDKVDKQQYRFRFSADNADKNSKATCNGIAAGKSVTAYFASADVLNTKAGMVNRYFGMNQTGTVYESSKKINAFYSGEPKAPAKVLK